MSEPAVAARHLPAADETEETEETDEIECAEESATDASIIAGLADRAERAGVGAVWTADYSATVELRRLAGPHDKTIGAGEWHWGAPGESIGCGPWRLASPAVRLVVYQWCLANGSQFEIYRWVNLVDLAAMWSTIALPSGVRAEWGRALRAAGLVPGAADN